MLIGDNAETVSNHLCNELETRISQHVKDQPDTPFLLGLSGGSLPKFLAMGAANMKVAWKNVKFFFCDERLVPFDDGDSTFKVYKEAFVGKVDGINEDSFVIIDPKLDVDSAAKDYQAKLVALQPDVNPPRFDALLLGMGPDGHTCSLFPGHALLDEKNLIVAPISDSPKPPPCRVTLTYPVINNAKACIFVCTGEGKKDIVRQILDEKADYPASRVKPNNGDLVWILDVGAASAMK